MRGQVVKAPPAAGVPVEGEVQLTELEKISPTRYDGVKTPANGFPILMMKAIAADPPTETTAAKEKAQSARPIGVLSKSKRAKAVDLVKQVLAGQVPIPVLAKDADGYDESADIAGALEVIRQISMLVCSEATSLGQGRLEEIWDIGTLMDALCSMKCFLGSERSQDNGGGQGDAGLNGSTGLDGAVSYKAAENTAVKAEKYSAEQKRQMMADGKAIPNAKGDPSYPIDDREDVDSAVQAVGRGKVPHAKIRAHIKRNAKRVGATDLIPDAWKAGKKTAKGAMLAGSGKNTSSKAAGSSTSTTDVIKQAVAEAGAASEERIKTLEAQLAKVLATPIPGGPLLVTPLTQRPAANPAIVKAERLRAIAAQTSDPAVATAYRELAAREERGAPITKD